MKMAFSPRGERVVRDSYVPFRPLTPSPRTVFFWGCFSFMFQCYFTSVLSALAWGQGFALTTHLPPWYGINTLIDPCRRHGFCRRQAEGVKDTFYFQLVIYAIQLHIRFATQVISFPTVSTVENVFLIDRKSKTRLRTHLPYRSFFVVNSIESAGSLNHMWSHYLLTHFMMTKHPHYRHDSSPVLHDSHYDSLLEKKHQWDEEFINSCFEDDEPLPVTQWVQSEVGRKIAWLHASTSVSYTHLTLPTICSV